MNGESVRYYVISDEEIEKIVETAAKAASEKAIAVYEKAKKDEYTGRKDRLIRNTALLLKNYRMLKMSADKSIFARCQMEESAADILDSMMNLYDDRIVIESIRRSATRTAIMVAHVENMISLYEVYCREKNSHTDRRKYEVLYASFIAEKEESVSELADRLCVSEDTIYSDLRMAKEQVSALMFGIDGINLGEG